MLPLPIYKASLNPNSYTVPSTITEPFPPTLIIPISLLSKKYGAFRGSIVSKTKSPFTGTAEPVIYLS
ncbi:hypothetical protein D3C85_1795720 [compost metagenome]